MPALAENPRLVAEHLFLDPAYCLNQDLHEVYKLNHLEIGWPDGARRLFDDMTRNHTAVFTGIQFGDESKGKFVDQKTGEILKIPGVQMVYVIRFNGGSNAGHTIETDKFRLAVHQIPSGILFPQAVGIMDRGMAIHPSDLQIEIEDIEAKVGDIRGKLYLSEEAILCTDLERAEEVLNRTLSGGKSKGGTSTGIGPGYAHHYDKLILQIRDLFNEKDDNNVSWRDKMQKKYQMRKQYFAAFGIDLAEVEVPDLRETRKAGQRVMRKVGTEQEFLDRMEATRTWFLERDRAVTDDKKMIRNTYLVHRNIYKDLSTGVIGEFGQGVGLHPWIGRLPDVTSSDTTLYGTIPGTAFWKPEDFSIRAGVMKLTWYSTVPDHAMACQVPYPADLPDVLPKDENGINKWKNYIDQNKDKLTASQLRMLWITMYTRNWGTTTGRLRGAHILDLEAIRYNARMSGIEAIAGSHLDVARVDEKGKPEDIVVCTHYTRNGEVVPYQPGLIYQKGIIPHFEHLPGWDGQEVQKATCYDELPLATKQFLTFVQRRTGYPIIAASTGPKRNQMLEFPGFDYDGPPYDPLKRSWLTYPSTN